MKQNAFNKHKGFNEKRTSCKFFGLVTPPSFTGC